MIVTDLGLHSWQEHSNTSATSQAWNRWSVVYALLHYLCCLVLQSQQGLSWSHVPQLEKLLPGVTIPARSQAQMKAIQRGGVVNPVSAQAAGHGSGQHSRQSADTAVIAL